LLAEGRVRSSGRARTVRPALSSGPEEIKSDSFLRAASHIDAYATNNKRLLKAALTIRLRYRHGCIAKEHRPERAAKMAAKIYRKLTFNPVGVGRLESLGHAHSSHFQRLRRLLLKKHGPQCQICGYQPKETAHLNAHEDWVYQIDDNGLTGRERKDLLCFYLPDIVLVCRRCHYTIHMNWYGSAARSAIWLGAPNTGVVRGGPKHYCEVNGCSYTTFRRDFAAALAVEKEFWASKEKAAMLPRLWGVAIDYGYFAPGYLDGEDDDDPWEARDDEADAYSYAMWEASLGGWTDQGTPIEEF
jgi:hypothetical protein